jgi:hypothetical protein
MPYRFDIYAQHQKHINTFLASDSVKLAMYALPSVIWGGAVLNLNATPQTSWQRAISEIFAEDSEVLSGNQRILENENQGQSGNGIWPFLYHGNQFSKGTRGEGCSAC